MCVTRVLPFYMCSECVSAHEDQCQLCVEGGGAGGAAGTPGCPPCVYLGQTAPPAPPLAQCGTDRGLMEPSLGPERNTPQRLDGEQAPPRWLNRSSVGEGGPDLPRLMGEC